LTEPEYQDILEYRGQVAIAEAFPISEFGATVETNIGGFMYGRDFFLGDIVQAKNEYGIEGAMRVTQFLISEDISGHRVYPTFVMI
jgi:hypothetical protein